MVVALAEALHKLGNKVILRRLRGTRRVTRFASLTGKFGLLLSRNVHTEPPRAAIRAVFFVSNAGFLNPKCGFDSRRGRKCALECKVAT